MTVSTCDQLAGDIGDETSGNELAIDVTEMATANRPTGAALSTHQQSDETLDFAAFVTMLLVGIIPGLVVGYSAGALCAGGAVLINVIHNLLPVFVFVMPLIIIGVLAISPMVYGMGVGQGVGYAGRLLNIRCSGAAWLAGD